MADLSTISVESNHPTPFGWRHPSHHPGPVMRAFDAGWGGAVWKTLGDPVTNVTSRFWANDYGNTRMMGLNNIELITDRPLEVNLKEMYEVKKRFPKNVLIA